jgi:hypothetical protein
MRMDAVAGSLGTADAKKMLEECLALCESVIGLQHPDTLTVKTNLAKCCRDDDDYDRAEALHRECWQVCRDSLGDQHPDTLDSLEHIALCALDKTDYTRARALYEEALQSRQQIHGEKVSFRVNLCSTLFKLFAAQHPRTVSWVRSVADVMFESGDLSVSGALLLPHFIFERCCV